MATRILYQHATATVMPSEYFSVSLGLHRKGFDLVYRMRDKATGREVARGKSGMLFFDYSQRKVMPVPEGFLQRVSGN